uniref:C3H1-type domain-containing protein n=1 Tax=Chromera velia CCMP2878 TaxID=1169474 RepID=A0A0G4I2I9_9ALVE|eukprot:Cvel_10425.t1-p1 / transcript=Cvel_10425.t1 / gene=Cvel_10425 / organism=Chromera_velia_CCMP2878 / gene_product=hypothetical protein / transcript_product=hypothetical protein / location=Cvel_scaffold628:44171-45055(+) / protein_length=295 / sequence_SO=supercontig / SO=protein_coding / is_pseudo=false
MCLNTFLHVQDLSQCDTKRRVLQRSRSLPPVPVSVRLGLDGIRCPTEPSAGGSFLQSMDNVGSLGHQEGRRCPVKRCYFAHTKKGCDKGWLCSHCHYCFATEKDREERTNRFRQHQQQFKSSKKFAGPGRNPNLLCTGLLLPPCPSSVCSSTSRYSTHSNRSRRPPCFSPSQNHTQPRRGIAGGQRGSGGYLTVNAGGYFLNSPPPPPYQQRRSFSDHDALSVLSTRAMSYSSLASSSSSSSSSSFSSSTATTHRSSTHDALMYRDEPEMPCRRQQMFLHHQRLLRVLERGRWRG